VAASDKPLFPNAQFYIAQRDFDFWTDEGKLDSSPKHFVVHARKICCRCATGSCSSGTARSSDGGAGHIVGHTMFMVTSERKSFAFLGDLTHHAILLA
jgi:hypothetical protein